MVIIVPFWPAGQRASAYMYAFVCVFCADHKLSGTVHRKHTDGTLPAALPLRARFAAFVVIVIVYVGEGVCMLIALRTSPLAAV